MLRLLANHSLVYGGATILSRGSLVATLLLLSLVIDPAAYGALGLITALSALVALIVPLEISQGLARYYTGASEPNKSRYAATAWWFTVMMLGAYIIVAEATAPVITRVLIGAPEFEGPVRVGIISMSLTSALYFLQAQFRWQFRPLDFLAASAIHALSTLSLSVGLAALINPPIIGVLIGQGLGAALACTFSFARLSRSLPLMLDRAMLTQMLRFSAPIVPASFALFAAIYASRLILNARGSLEDVGHFTFAGQIAGLITLMIVGVQAALTPLIMSRYQDPDTPAVLAQAFELFAVAALIASLILGFASLEIIQAVGRDDYGAAAPLVLILAPALIIREMYIFAPGFAVAKKTMSQLRVSLTSSFAGILVTTLLVLQMGLLGAAFGTLISAILFLGLWCLNSDRYYPIPIRWRRLAPACAVAAVVAFVGAQLSELPQSLRIVSRVVLTFFALVCMIALGLLPLGRIASALAARYRRSAL